MISQCLKIGNESGLHARPASKLTKLAGAYQSSVMLEYGSQLVDTKSIIAILSSGIKGMDEVKLIVEGEDEAEAIKAVSELLMNGLGE